MPALPRIDDRRSVWLALSELYLDTELDGSRLDAIAAALATTSYSLMELDHIRTREVRPILWHSGSTPAGPWEAYDPEWLIAAIERRLARPRWLRWSFVWNDVGGEPWADVAERIERLRAMSGGVVDDSVES